MSVREEYCEDCGARLVWLVEDLTGSIFGPELYCAKCKLFYDRDMWWSTIEPPGVMYIELC